MHKVYQWRCMLQLIDNVYLVTSVFYLVIIDQVAQQLI
uniref:Uncharacterized protein n=1 Tax=Arundo donax TaxID=35708 RepID=A0A0A9FDN1_ARUDO